MSDSLRRTQQRPPRNRYELGDVGPLRFGVRRLSRGGRGGVAPTGLPGALPPYVAIPRNPSFTWELGKSAYLGGRYESFRTGDPNASDFQVQDVAPLETLSDRSTARRQSLLQAVDGLARQVHGNDQMATYTEFQQRAATMVWSGSARSAFAVSQEA